MRFFPLFSVFAFWMGIPLYRFFATMQRRVFGLTGGIACGKSTAEACFRACGCAVLDADAVVRALEAPGGAAVGAVAAAFGAGMVGADGGVDRRALGALVFGDAAARARLEGIVLPLVRREAEAWLAGLPAEALAVFSAATLYEQGWDLGWRGVVCVMASEATQVRRLMGARGLTMAEARARLAAQMPPAEKARRADWVLDNDSDDLPALRRQVERLVARWRRLAQE